MPTRLKINAGWFRLRYEILERDQFTCQYCGQFAPNVQLEVDHVVAVEDGGTDDHDNLKTACWACNRGKNALRQRSKRPPARAAGTWSRGAPRTGTQPGTKTAEAMSIWRDRPLATTREVAEVIGVPVDSARMMRNRLRRRMEIAPW